MGVAVEVEPDSPKLLELLESPIYNHTYYARQLHTGLTALNAQLGLQQQQRPVEATTA
jgi:hypothetical protein